MSRDEEYDNSNRGALFQKDPEDVKSKNHPTWSGTFEIECPECGCSSEGYLDAWVKKKDSEKVYKGRYLSIAMKFKEKRRATTKKSSRREREPGEDDGDEDDI